MRFDENSEELSKLGFYLDQSRTLSLQRFNPVIFLEILEFSKTYFHHSENLLNDGIEEKIYQEKNRRNLKDNNSHFSFRFILELLNKEVYFQ